MVALRRVLKLLFDLDGLAVGLKEGIVLRIVLFNDVIELVFKIKKYE